MNAQVTLHSHENSITDRLSIRQTLRSHGTSIENRLNIGQAGALAVVILQRTQRSLSAIVHIAAKEVDVQLKFGQLQWRHRGPASLEGLQNGPTVVSQEGSKIVAGETDVVKSSQLAIARQRMNANMAAQGLIRRLMKLALARVGARKHDEDDG